MKRDYAQGEQDNVTFFTGVEVEKTPAYGMVTLFVTDLQPVTDINLAIDTHYKLGGKPIKHIFFGANHSFKPTEYKEWKAWETMIEHFLKLDMWCSLDIPLSAVEEFNDGGLNDYYNFIPQIRVPVPYIKLWNYNTMLKIDDKDFKATNPGVWCHQLHDLKDRKVFTDWSKYTQDEVIR